MNRADDEPRAHIDSTPSLAWCASPDGSGLSFNRSWPDYTSLTAEEALGWGRKVAVPAAVILCVGMCLLAGCHSRTPARAIEFSRIPEANPGGRETQDIIERIRHGRPARTTDRPVREKRALVCSAVGDASLHQAHGPSRGHEVDQRHTFGDRVCGDSGRPGIPSATGGGRVAK